MNQLHNTASVLMATAQRSGCREIFRSRIDGTVRTSGFATEPNSMSKTLGGLPDVSLQEPR